MADTNMRDVPAAVQFDPSTGELRLTVTDPDAARMAWRVEHLVVEVEREGRKRTSELSRDWIIREGPDGPVESLAPYTYLTSFLSEQASKNPQATPRELLMAWSIRHPQPTHDTDPRGRLVSGTSDNVPLDDGGVIQLSVEQHRTPGGSWKKTAQILRLPYRALSWREFTSLFEMMRRTVAADAPASRRVEIRRAANAARAALDELIAQLADDEEVRQ